jgi:uncharacterized protein (TIGR04255 family)
VTEYQHLSQPPLREAVIAIQFSEDLPAATILNLRDRKVAGYGVVRATKRGQFRLQIEMEKASHAAVTRDEMDGWRYDSADGSRVLQLRRTGMIFSAVREYTNWSDFRASAFDLWTEFASVVGQAEVGRLEVRYINVLQIPLGADFDQYLTAGPRIPAKLPQIFSQYVSRIEIPIPGSEATAVVTQVLEPAAVPENRPLIVDIDVQTAKHFLKDSPEIWSHLDRLRDIKNLIFFSSLTDKALEPYL